MQIKNYFKISYVNDPKMPGVMDRQISIVNCWLSNTICYKNVFKNFSRYSANSCKTVSGIQQDKG